MRAVAIPADPNVSITIVTDVGETRQDFARAIGAQYIERVSCTLTRRHHLVLVVDDSGRIAHKPYNPRADLLYLHGIYGDALLVQEDAPGTEGWDFTNLTISDVDVLALLTP